MVLITEEVHLPCLDQRRNVIILYTLNDEGIFVPQGVNINRVPVSITEEQYGFDYGVGSPSL